MDTIFAEATPAGRGGVSVMRISGPDAWRAVHSLTGRHAAPRHAFLSDLRDDGELIDTALILLFEQGRSFTGEESAELHLHGAPVIVSRISVALKNLGLRPADAGEFTRRSFLNGKVDLAQTEGLADLLAAETESQRRLAMRGADGELSRLVEDWRRDLIRAGALIEVTLDFPDEEVPDEVPAESWDLIRRVAASIEEVLVGYPAAERLRTGFEVAIIGPPNAGKSTLINAIAKREVALVSEFAGTTRDIIELRVDLRGLAVTFLDTAGLRDAEDQIEGMGIDRARGRAAAADLRIHLSPDCSKESELWIAGDILCRSKSDLSAGKGRSISAKTGQGVAELLNAVHLELKERIAPAGLVSRQRQAAALEAALKHLQNIEESPELAAESLRLANYALQSMVGRIGAEDYLDIIFSSFCIGK